MRIKKHSILCCIAIAAAMLILVACSPTPGNDFTQPPTVEPTAEPTVEPTAVPTKVPAATPTAKPTETPTEEPVQDLINGVSRHDYEKVRSFLEIKDENGIRNGEKINPSYDPDDHTTWFYNDGSDDEPNLEQIAEWDEFGRLSSLYFPPLGIVGELDLSYCSGLQYVISHNGTRDEEINNSISTLNITGCNEPLMNVWFAYSGLERIIPDTINSACVDLYGNKLQYINWICRDDGVHVKSAWNFDVKLTADGAGYVGISPGDRTHYMELYIEATPEEGHTFIGWFNRDGVLISEEAYYEISSPEMRGCTGIYDYVARFE